MLISCLERVCFFSLLTSIPVIVLIVFNLINSSGSSIEKRSIGIFSVYALYINIFLRNIVLPSEGLPAIVTKLPPGIPHRYSSSLVNPVLKPNTCSTSPSTYVSGSGIILKISSPIILVVETVLLSIASNLVKAESIISKPFKVVCVRTVLLILSATATLCLIKYLLLRISKYSL